MNKELIEAIKAKFEKGLQAKTGWGRVEVMNLFNDSVNQSVLEMLDKRDADTKKEA
jgi:hypothetical protein